MMSITAGPYHIWTGSYGLNRRFLGRIACNTVYRYRYETGKQLICGEAGFSFVPGKEE